MAEVVAAREGGGGVVHAIVFEWEGEVAGKASERYVGGGGRERREADGRRRAGWEMERMALVVGRGGGGGYEREDKGSF